MFLSNTYKNNSCILTGNRALKDLKYLLKCYFVEEEMGEKYRTSIKIKCYGWIEALELANTIWVLCWKEKGKREKKMLLGGCISLLGLSEQMSQIWSLQLYKFIFNYLKGRSSRWSADQFDFLCGLPFPIAFVCLLVCLVCLPLLFCLFLHGCSFLHIYRCVTL